MHFSYDGKTEVIKGVSLDIQPGQTVAFVGPSGGGKSTLANLVYRFFDVQSGSVRVGEADVRDIPKEELMDTISFVFQNSRLLKVRCAVENDVFDSLPQDSLLNELEMGD